jgi:hypothetical protein
MAPSRPQSGNRTLPLEPSAGGAQTTLPKASISSGAGTSLLRKRKVWIVAALAAAVVIAIGMADQLGLGDQLFNRWSTLGVVPSAATFVGSETCAGCHRAEAELWRRSQHTRDVLTRGGGHREQHKVAAAMGVTVKSMSQLGEIMFRPRLFEVVKKHELLTSLVSVPDRRLSALPGAHKS